MREPDKLRRLAGQEKNVRGQGQILLLWRGLCLLWLHVCHHKNLPDRQRHVLVSVCWRPNKQQHQHYSHWYRTGTTGLVWHLKWIQWTEFIWRNGCVADRSVILESPALPVSHGAAVTLRCRPKLNSSDHMFHFYREGHLISHSSTGAMTIPYVSKSDEGLYKCSITGGEESESSWLAVEGNSLEIMRPISFLSNSDLGLCFQQMEQVSNTVEESLEKETYFILLLIPVYHIHLLASAS